MEMEKPSLTAVAQLDGTYTDIPRGLPLCTDVAFSTIEGVRPDTLKEIRDAAETEKGTCSLLYKLPREIRDQIWRGLFKRPIAIVPTVVVKYAPEVKTGYQKRYGYVWDASKACRARDSFKTGADLPGDNKYDGTVEKVMVVWHCEPTREQVAIMRRWFAVEAAFLAQPEPTPPKYSRSISIRKGEFPRMSSGRRKPKVATQRPPFPSYYDKNLGSEVMYSSTPTRDDRMADFTYQAVLYIRSFSGLGILGTCKQIEREATEILYSENTFVFNAHDQNASQSPKLPGPLFLKQFGRVLDEVRAVNSDLTTTGPFRIAIQDLLAAHEENPGADEGESFAQRNGLAKFLSTIGRHNAAKIRRIKLEGQFRPLLTHSVDDASGATGLRRLLPMYSMIFRELCSNLRELTVHRKRDMKYWDITSNFKALEICPQEVFDTVGLTVKALPRLSKLNLTRDFVNGWTPIWGKTREWEKIVAIRHSSSRQMAAPARSWYPTGDESTC